MDSLPCDLFGSKRGVMVVAAIRVHVSALSRFVVFSHYVEANFHAPSNVDTWMLAKPLLKVPTRRSQTLTVL